MKNEKSLARMEYEIFYRTLRLNGGSYNYEFPVRNYSELEDCALLSYDYYDSEFSGWINRQRMHQFHNRSEAVATAGQWPF